MHAIKPGIVIVGAGFGGIEVAKKLLDVTERVTVVDRRNYTLFEPLLYQVATAALSPADVATPIRSLLHGANVEVLLDEVTGVDAARSCVRTARGHEIPFRFLVLATGSTTNYFGNEDWAMVAPSPKSLDDAVAIRRRLLLAFEEAEMCDDDAERQALMTFVIVGAGPTGVEMAAAIAELANTILVRDFRRIDPTSTRIHLIEAGPTVLGTYSEPLRTYAQEALTRLRIDVRLNTRIERIDRRGVIAGGQRIASRVVIWGAGMKSTPVALWLTMETTDRGTLKVNPDFSVPGRPNIFAIGDAAYALGPDGHPLAGLAAVAKQEGRYVGELIRRRVAGKPAMPPFRYRDYGTMTTVGRSRAVADLRGFKFTGRFAWLLWGVVHIYFLIGFRNRVVVLVNWFWAWLTHSYGARVVCGSEAAAAAPIEKRPQMRDNVSRGGVPM